MIPFTLKQIADATGGRIVPAADGSGGSDTLDGVLVDGPVVTDSREAAPGSLYVARVGEHADGHDYVPGAAAAGAVAALVTRPVASLPGVVVDDVQEAFAALAQAVVRRQVDEAGLVVVGITGSSGKTTAKDLLAHVLAEHRETVANVGSLNSEVGVPLTVCRITDSTGVLVLEMGARGVGHIDYLTRMTSPSVGVVLNVGSAHLGEFGSRETIARAKSELVASLPAEGLAVLNADDALVRGMAQATSARVRLVGRSPDADLRATDVTLDDLGAASFTLHAAGERVPVRLSLLGEHQVDNALAVAAVALELGMSPAEIADRLESARPASRWRMERHLRDDGVIVINDAYNANPESMAGALRTLAHMKRSGRSMAVLGAMYELGADSEAEHRRVGELAADLELDVLVAVGPDAGPIGDGATAHGAPNSPRVLRADTLETAQTLLEDELAPGDVVLLKSSRDAGLRTLGDRLVGQEESA